MTNETHTQYQRELSVLIDALDTELTVENMDETTDYFDIRQRLREMAQMLIVRDDLDELVEVAQRLFPDGYKELAQTLSQARTALDDPAGLVRAQPVTTDDATYAIAKLDEAINVLVVEPRCHDASFINADGVCEHDDHYSG